MAEIIYSPNAFDLKKDRVVKTLNDVSIRDAVESFNLESDELVIQINGRTPKKIDASKIIKENDVIYITHALKGGGGESSNKLVSTIIQVVAVIGAVVAASFQLYGLASLIIGAGFSIAGVVYQAGIKDPSIGLDEGPDSKAAGQSYAIGAARNQARLFKPLPVPMGEHRQYPDIGSRPYGGLFFEPIQESFKTEEVPSSFNMLEFGAIEDWSYVDSPIYINYVNTTRAFYRFPLLIDPLSYKHFFIDGNSFTYNKITVTAPNGRILKFYPLFYHHISTDPHFGKIRPGYHFISAKNSANALPFGGGQDVEDMERRLDLLTAFTQQDIESYSFEVTEFTDVNTSDEPAQNELYHIFNYGFGDLEISDERVGDTLENEYNGIEFINNTKNNLSWPLDSTFVNDNVATVEGAALVNSNTLPAPESGATVGLPGTNLSLQNWIQREGPSEVNRIEVQVEARLFKTGQTIEPNSAQIQIQYKRVTDPTWTDIGLNTITIGSINMTPTKKIYSVNVPTDKYEIRARKINKDATEATEVDEVNMTSVRFYRTVTSPYVAQNRQGVKFTASAQLNGTIDKWNALVKVRCWVFDFNSQTWLWTFTKNPAWWALYWARGGFENQTATGALTYPYSPTQGWVNSSDHPDNIRRLWGMGLEDSKIDIESFKQWAQFCDNKNLEFSAVVDGDGNAAEFFSRIASVGRASATWANGKLGVIFENETDPSVGVFGMANIKKDTFNISYKLDQMPDTIVAQYNDENNYWRQGEVRVDRPGVTDPITEQSIFFWGVTNEEQARREANLIAAKNLYQRRLISFETDIEHMLVNRGDVIQLSHDMVQYGQSGRVFALKATNGIVTELELECELIDSNYITIRHLDGSLVDYSCVASGRIVTLTNGFPLSIAPYHIDQNGGTNPVSQHPDSAIEDLVFVTGPTATPGKRARIISILPRDNNSAQITCADEELAIYGLEYNDIPVTIPEPVPEDYTIVHSRVLNACAEDLGGGRVQLDWELDGAVAATIQYRFNGGPWLQLTANGSITVFGNEVSANIAPNVFVDFIISPVVLGTSHQTTQETVSIQLGG